MSSRTPSYITQNRLGIYILQIRVPKKIIKKRPDGKKIIQRSLRTRDRREALSLARRMVIKMEESNFTWEAEVERADEHFRLGHALYTELLRLNESGDPLLLDDFFAQLSPKEEKAISYLAEHHRSLEQTIQHLFDQHQEVEAWQSINRAQMLFRSDLQRKFQHFAPSSEAISSSSSIKVAQKKERPRNDIRLDEAAKKWHLAHKAGMSKSSFPEYSRMIGLFVRIVQHIHNGEHPYTSELTADTIRKYKEFIAEMPKSVKTEGKSIEDLIRLDGPKKSATTIKNIFSNVGHLFIWLEGEGYNLMHNAHTVLTSYRKIKTSEKKRRAPLDEQDLTALFNSNDYRTGAFTRYSDYWAPLIALFTGACRNEILQLDVDDIKKVEGIYVFDINDRGDKILKESNDFDDDEATGRPRLIPIHQQLINLGLINYVKERITKGCKKLFPIEKRNSRGHFGAFGNRFCRYRKKVGVVPRHDKEYRDFHSFRHLMRSKLDRVRNKEEGITDDIMGHTSSGRSSIGKRYSHEERVELKKEALNQISYDFIDFKSMTRWSDMKFKEEIKIHE